MEDANWTRRRDGEATSREGGEAQSGDRKASCWSAHPEKRVTQLCRLEVLGRQRMSASELFLTTIWAAVTSRTRGEFGHGKQIELPLKWLAAFVNNVNGSLRRHFRPRAAMAMVITFDGSPEGGGATLQLVVPTSADRSVHKIEYYWHTGDSRRREGGESNNRGPSFASDVGSIPVAAGSNGMATSIGMHGRPAGVRG